MRLEVGLELVAEAYNDEAIAFKTAVEGLKKTGLWNGAVWRRRGKRNKGSLKRGHLGGHLEVCLEVRGSCA